MKSLALVALATLSLSFCGKKSTTDDTPATVVATPSDCFTLNVKPISDQKCAMCHASHSVSRWYDSKVAFLASRAKARVALGDMPQPGQIQLTAAEKSTFANCN